LGIIFRKEKYNINVTQGGKPPFKTLLLIILKKTASQFLILVIAFFVVMHLSNQILNTDQLLINSLSENFTARQLEQYLNFQHKWQWLLYILMPLFILVKMILTALILYIGIYFFTKPTITYFQLFEITIKAEFIFLLVPLFKTIWFLFFQTNYTLQDVQSSYPFSALNIVGYKDLETWFIYPFQVLNLFELFYIIYLGCQIGKLTNTNTDYGLKIVALSYVPSLLLWVTVVMFFTLNYS
jgi:hypothetical protein